MNNIHMFLDEEGRIKQLPAKAERKLEVLFYLAEKFDSERDYTEKEVNTLITDWHTFGDYFVLRRELVDCGLLCRTSNGSRYWRSEPPVAPKTPES